MTSRRRTGAQFDSKPVLVINRVQTAMQYIADEQCILCSGACPGVTVIFSDNCHVYPSYEYILLENDQVTVNL